MNLSSLAWYPSDYLDCEAWGVVDGENRIHLGHSLRLTRAQCRAIASAHNIALSLVRWPREASEVKR